MQANYLRGIGHITSIKNDVRSYTKSIINEEKTFAEKRWKNHNEEDREFEESDLSLIWSKRQHVMSRQNNWLRKGYTNNIQWGGEKKKWKEMKNY